MRTTVKEIMTTRATTIGERTPFKEVVEIMRRDAVHALPVVDSTGQVRGIVSASDLLFKEAEPAAPAGFRLSRARRRARRKAEAVSAAELMTAPPITVPATITAEEAARTMNRHDIDQLPVVEILSGRVIGMVSRSDVLAVYRRPDADIQREIFTDVIAGRFGPDRTRFGVTVEDGRVTVQGTVRTAAEGDALMHAVRQVEGVVSATSLLRPGTTEMPSAHH